MLMQKRAFWLAPLVSTVPLIPFFSLPSSPLFLGRLMGDSFGHPFLWPQLGPWLAAAAVIFDATVLAYFVAVPVYLAVFVSRRYNRWSMPGVTALFGLAGVLASQVVHIFQNFRQPALREFAGSWMSPLLGCLCGLISASLFALLTTRKFSPIERALAGWLPPAVLLTSGAVLVWSAR